MNTIIKINNKIFPASSFILCTFFSFTLFALTIFCVPKNSYAKTENTPKFKNNYNTVYIGNSYKYTIINSPKNTITKFSISNKKIAKINSKTGLLIPKKKGTLTLKATIKSTTKKNIITLTQKVTIKNQISVENNEEFFYPSKHINSINFTIRLKSARIMQQSQVENSSISLTKDTYIVKGNFKSLSDDGRYITYELNNSSIKLLSPGDSSMNGTYELACTLSQNKYNIDYIEHILGQSVTGFVFDRSGNALENASITLTNNDITVTTKTDKNGYYIIRFPKVENVNMSVSCPNYISKTINNINLKITKSICKNIILHNDTSKNLSPSALTAFFNITDNSQYPKKIEITSLNSNFSDRSQINNNIFFTNASGKLLLANNKNNTDISHTDADIINISDNINTLSHADTFYPNDALKDTFNFSSATDYCIKVYSIDNNSYSLKSEFCFSFNDFTSDNIVFNISLPAIEKTNYPDLLLPITMGSNISSDKINYYNASLYRIGNEMPICSFSFYENTPADFKNQINKLNLYLNDGNFYYAIFKIYDKTDQELLSPVLYRFEVKNSKIYFENTSIEFNTTSTVDNKFSLLPLYKNTIIDISLLPQDKSCLNTVLCSYNNDGNIKTATLTSLSSQLLQYELLNAGNSYIIYTDNSEFSIPITDIT